MTPANIHMLQQAGDYPRVPVGLLVARLAFQAALLALLAWVDEALSAGSTESWWQRFNQVGVPAGPVYTVPQALNHPQVAQRGMVATYPDVPGVGRDVRVVRTGFKLNGQPPTVASPPPRLGEHTVAILGELGYDAAAVASLQEEKVV